MLGIFTVDNERQHHAPPATRLSEAPRGPAGHWLHSLNGYFQISGGKNVFQREAGRRFSQYALWRVHPRYQTDSGSRKRRPSVVRLKSHNPRSKESFKPGRKYNFVTNAGKRWWFVQTMLNENGIKKIFFFCWCELWDPDAGLWCALHCLVELQEIERRDRGSAGGGEKGEEDAQHDGAFWDTTDGNEKTLRDLQGSCSQNVRTYGEISHRENTRSKKWFLLYLFFLLTKRRFNISEAHAAS